MRRADVSGRVKPLFPADPYRVGPYRILGRLGSGGMGTVYYAESQQGEAVALKLLHPTLADNQEFLGRFRSELNRAQEVPSFCTAEVLDANLEHQPPYLVVEFVDGPSLSEVVEERGPLTGTTLHSVAVGVATALSGIHSAGVIHRDLKPDNVLLPPGSPKVIDFGIARAYEATSKHTRTDQFVGTVAYMAPERFDNETGKPDVGPSADIFAWGCIVAYAGTGHTPFRGDTPTVTAARILTQPPNLDGLDPRLRGVVERSLDKNPQRRPSARELLDELTGIRQTPRTPPRGMRRRRRVRRRLAIPIMAALAALLMAGLAAVALAATGTAPWSPLRAKSASSITADVQDRLNAWIDVGKVTKGVSCEVGKQSLKVSISVPGVFDCGGRSAEVSDFGIVVKSAPGQGNACVAVFFLWNEAENTGDMAAICPEKVLLSTVTQDSLNNFGAIAVQPPTESRPFTTELVMKDGGVAISRNGVAVTAVLLQAGAPAKGSVWLGISGDAGRGSAPYGVDIYDAQFRTPA